MMIGIQHRPLYIMIKPHPQKLSHIASLRTVHCIDTSYAAERLHSTLVRFGETTQETIASVGHALDAFRADPFPVEFDHVRGNVLMGSRGRPLPGKTQRALTQHLLAAGCPVLGHRFRLHMTLDYRTRPDHQIVIPPIGWLADEILLIESIHPERRHEVHGSWRLEPRQRTFEF